MRTRMQQKAVDRFVSVTACTLTWLKSSSFALPEFYLHLRTDAFEPIHQVK